MAELTNDEIYKARFEMQAARIEELEKENAHYVELLSKYAKETAEMKRQADEVEKVKQQIIKILYGDGSDGEACAKIMELIK